MKRIGKHFKIVNIPIPFRLRAQASLKTLIIYIFKGYWITPSYYQTFAECAPDDPKAVAEECVFLSSMPYSIAEIKKDKVYEC